MIGATFNFPDGTTRDIQISAEVIAGVVAVRLEDIGTLEADEVQLNGELFFAAHPDQAA